MQQDQNADWHVADLTSKIAAMFGDFFRSLKAREERLAWVMALGADTLQLAVFPLFVEGIPADTDDRAPSRCGPVSDMDGCGGLRDPATIPSERTSHPAARVSRRRYPSIQSIVMAG